MSPVLDVAWLPVELPGSPAAGGAAVVVDVVRATTSAVTALAAGARRVIPVADVDEARRRAAAEGGALLCGERGGLPLEGFDLGNSPSSYTAARVADRTIILTTSNGTAAMVAAAGASALWLACFRNAAAAVRRLLSVLDAPGTPGAVVVCAGRRGRVSMDDAWCAGHLVGRAARIRPGLSLTDGARAAMELAAALGPPTAASLAATAAGEGLLGLELQRDLEDCAMLDDLGVVPVWRGGAFVTGGEENIDDG